MTWCHDLCGNCWSRKQHCTSTRTWTCVMHNPQTIENGSVSLTMFNPLRTSSNDNSRVPSFKSSNKSPIICLCAWRYKHACSIWVVLLRSYGYVASLTIKVLPSCLTNLEANFSTEIRKQKESQHKNMISFTLFSWELIHLVKVFFWISSRSSTKNKHQTGDSLFSAAIHLSGKPCGYILT